MITLLNGQNDSKPYRGKVYGGVRVCFTAVNATTNDTLTSAELLVQNLLIQAHLNRDGKEHQIMSINGDVLACGVFDSSFDFFNPDNTGNEGYNLITKAAVGVAETGLVAVDFPFGGPLDVSASGHIQLSVQASTGIFASTLNQNLSNVTIDLIPIEGVEAGLPQVITQPIMANESNPTFSAGDGIRSLFFLNRDKAGIVSANQVLSSATVQSDEKNESLSYQQLISKRNTMFPWNELSNDRGQTFCLLPFHPSKLYFGVNVNASAVSANVTSSKNYWVAFKICPSSASVNTGRSSAIEMNAKIQKYINQTA
jgi:hypothetical protein